MDLCGKLVPRDLRFPRPPVAPHPVGTKARLALELALGTAQRRADLLRIKDFWR